MQSATKGFDAAAAAASGVICFGSFVFIHSVTVSSVTATPVPSPASKQERQQPRIISAMLFRLAPISPFRRESNPGMSPGFLTINAMSSEGSPPMLKNSSPFSSTNSLKVGCVARRTRWPYVSLRTLPSATKGWTSPKAYQPAFQKMLVRHVPLDPTTWITTFILGGGT